MTHPGDKCANPRCGHIRLVHATRCESLNTVSPCACESFVVPQGPETPEAAR